MKNKKTIIIITATIFILLVTAPWMNKQTTHDRVFNEKAKIDGSINKKTGELICDYNVNWLPFGRFVSSCEGGYFVPFFYFKKEKENDDNAKKQTISENGNKVAETTDWKTYKNEKYGFEFKYPIFWGDIVIEDNSVVFGPKDDFFGADIDYKKLLTEKYSLGFSKNKNLEIKITSFSEKKPLRLNCYEGFCGTDNLFDDKAYVEKKYNKENGGLKLFCEENYFAPAANLFKACRVYVGTNMVELAIGHQLENTMDSYKLEFKNNRTPSFQDVYKKLKGDEKKNFDNKLELFDQILSTFKFTD